MSDEEEKRFENDLLEKISKMTGRLTDRPRFQLSGEIIPESLLMEDLDKTNSELH